MGFTYVCNFRSRWKSSMKRKSKMLSMRLEYLHRYSKEVFLICTYRHQNVIGYKEAFFDENSQTLCIVMEFADGGDLY
jgi:NIMA (never in mitosis gene a)-related kinase 1/4/5